MKEYKVTVLGRDGGTIETYSIRSAGGSEAAEARHLADGNAATHGTGCTVVIEVVVRGETKRQWKFRTGRGVKSGRLGVRLLEKPAIFRRQRRSEKRGSSTAALGKHMKRHERHEEAEPAPASGDTTAEPSLSEWSYNSQTKTFSRTIEGKRYRIRARFSGYQVTREFNGKWRTIAKKIKSRQLAADLALEDADAPERQFVKNVPITIRERVTCHKECSPKFKRKGEKRKRDTTANLRRHMRRDAK